MSFLFGSTKQPAFNMPPAPAVTKPADQAKIKEDEKKKLSQGRTARSTLLTGPRGLLEPANVQRKTLLGA